jgi:hypothetical protein
MMGKKAKICIKHKQKYSKNKLIKLSLSQKMCWVWVERKIIQGILV